MVCLQQVNLPFIAKRSLLKLLLAYFYEYVDICFEDNSVETKAFYLPERL